MAKSHEIYILAVPIANQVDRVCYLEDVLYKAEESALFTWQAFF